MAELMTVPTVIAEVAFPVGASTSTWLHFDDPARGLLDTATLGTGDEVWTDVSADLLTVSTMRGSRRVDSPVVLYDAGTGTITLKDLSRDYDPDNLAGPYVSGGVTQVTPMRAVRVRAEWNSTIYDILRGYADDWITTYDGPNLARVAVPITDGFQVLEKYIRAASGAAGASEDAGARVDRILDSAQWSATDRIVATGDTTLQATTLEGSALAELKLVAETEAGELYIDAAGRVVFRNRNAILTDTRSTTSQGTFGDEDPELRYSDAVPAYDKASLFNNVMITREGGAEQTASDSTSIQTYLTRTYQKSGLLMETDSAALDYASWICHLAKDPERRFATLTIRPHRDPDNLFPQVLGREIGDRITVIRRPPGGGDPIERDVFIRGIAHEIRAGGTDWTTTWTLQPAGRYAFLVLDHADMGVLDANALAY